MLRRIETVKGYTIHATDGEIGKVQELFFDENSWIVRYVVVDVGSWLVGRRILIAPTAVSRIDSSHKQLFVNLDKDQIENSPSVAADEPVSREQERALHEYYQWQPYWASSINNPFVYGAFPMGMASAVYQTAHQEQLDEKLNEATAEKSTLRSTAEVTSYYIQGNDGEIGHVADFLFDDEEWVIRYLVVDTGNWLPGRKVLLAPPWIRRIEWAEKRVYVALTQENIRRGPSFEPEKLGETDYEGRLLQEYKEWFAYLLEEREQEDTHLFLGKDVIGNPVINVHNGRHIGKVKDLYLTLDCRRVSALYLGSEGLFSRQSYLIPSQSVVVIGEDATLVENGEVIREVKEVPEAETWLRRDELQGRAIDTPGGTKVGTVGDVIMNKNGRILGFSLANVYVSGPVAENRSIALHAVKDTGQADGSMIIELEQAEKQRLQVR